MAKAKRWEWAHFLNTGTPWTPSASTGVVWSRINKGFTEMTEDANAEVTEEQYIGDKNSSASIDRYAMSAGLDGVAFKEDAIFEVLDTIHRTRAVGEDCEYQLLNVDIYNPTTDPQTSAVSYPAQIQPVVIEITSWGGEVNLGVGATLHYNGDPVFGTCTITSGVPTFTPAV